MRADRTQAWTLVTCLLGNVLTQRRYFKSMGLTWMQSRTSSSHGQGCQISVQLTGWWMRSSQNWWRHKVDPIMLHNSWHGRENRFWPTRTGWLLKLCCLTRCLFGLKRDENGEWRRIYNEDVHSLYRSGNIDRVIKCRRLRWTGHVAGIGEGKPTEKRPVGRPRLRWTMLEWILKK